MGYASSISLVSVCDYFTDDSHKYQDQRQSNRRAIGDEKSKHIVVHRAILFLLITVYPFFYDDRDLV